MLGEAFSRFFSGLDADFEEAIKHESKVKHFDNCLLKTLLTPSPVKLTIMDNFYEFYPCCLVLEVKNDEQRLDHDMPGAGNVNYNDNNTAEWSGAYENNDYLAFEKVHLSASEQVQLDLNILYVEDKQMNRKVLKIMLESLGCTVQLAINGKEGIQIYNDHQNYDIILMDIQMPVMDGISATKELKARYPNLPPVIAVTAFLDVEDFEGFKLADFADVIYKPVYIQEILEKLIYWSQKT